MSRPIRLIFAIIPVFLLSAASFIGGQALRRSTVRHFSHTLLLDNRVSSLPGSGIGGTASDDSGDQDDVAPGETFREVLRYIKSDYVDRVDDDKKLGFGAVKSMLSSLDDPKTRFLDPAQRLQLIEQINGRFKGICATLTVIKQRQGAGKSAIELRRLAIVAPAPGGPAERAGLLPGDVISEIDGKWVIAYDPRLEVEQQFGDAPEDDKQAQHAAHEAVDKLAKGIALPKALESLQSANGKTITLTVERPGNPRPLKISVPTGEFSLSPVDFRTLSPQAAYLRITQFNDQATDRFIPVLESLNSHALIIDLRNNAGGPITGRQSGPLGSALALVAKLAGAGQAGSVARRGGRADALTVTGTALTGPKIIVLVNGGTANIAEMAAAALKERAGATIIGSATFGDSVYQKLVELRDGAGMTVTTGKLLTARGTDFSSKGIVLDIQVPTAGPRSDDAVVQRAIEAG